jgi:hypothetical protein
MLHSTAMQIVTILSLNFWIQSFIKDQERTGILLTIMATLQGEEGVPKMGF